MPLIFDYYHPSKEKPEFMVSRITDGYEFTLFDEQGNPEQVFSINSSIVDLPHAATGYVGREGMAIEKFRERLRISD